MNDTNTNTNVGSSNTFVNWTLGIVSVLVAALIIGAIGYGFKTSERMAVIEYQLQQQSEEAELDREQSKSIAKLWQAAAQNKAAINNRHRNDPDHPYHEWNIVEPEVD